MKWKPYIDDREVIVPNDNLLYPNFTFRKKNETGEKAVSFTGDIIFTGVDADYIRERLIDHADAVNNKVILKFESTCCAEKITYLFQIKPESLEWCDNQCDIKAAAVEYSNSFDQLNCLKSTLVYDNHDGFQDNANHPKVSYCIEMRPSALQDVILIMVIILNIILVALYPVVLVIEIILTFINKIIDALNSIPGVSLDNIGDFDGNPSTGTIDEYRNFIASLNEIVIGCGRKHPSPYLREYIKNVCRKCGIAFQSSILNDSNSEYFNTIYFNAPIRKGVLSDDNTTFIQKNRPILNGVMLLNQIKSVHNSDWVIENNILYYEREDYFVPVVPWLDLTTYDKDKILKVCYKWTNKPRYAYANLYYQNDAVNWIGSEAGERYGDIIEWNNPYSPKQKDEYKPLLAFAPSRFRDDGIERDVLSSYKGAPFIGATIRRYENVMLMNNGTQYAPSLLIYDQATGKIKRNYSVPSESGIPYNYPYWFKEVQAGNLYTNFHFIKNPKYIAWKGYDNTTEIIFDCTTLKNINLAGRIKTENGLIKIDSITVNNKEDKMIISGTI